MDDFVPVVRKRGPLAVKYPEQQLSLVAMCFKASAVTAALETSQGNIDLAIVILLGEIDPNEPAAIPSNLGSKSEETTKVHNKIMATYKVQKCKERNSHDIGKCVYWHTKADRRRNPFETPLYGCMECSQDQLASAIQLCSEGDACLKTHNKHEKMFHPEIFKMTMCQRGEANGAKCSRGVFCAFAHSYEDSRKTAAMYRKLESRNVTGAAYSSSFVPPYNHNIIGKNATNGYSNDDDEDDDKINQKQETTEPSVVTKMEPEKIVTAAPAEKLSNLSQPIRRRGPSEPVSNLSLEVARTPQSPQSFDSVPESTEYFQNLAQSFQTEGNVNSLNRAAPGLMPLQNSHIPPSANFDIQSVPQPPPVGPSPAGPPPLILAPAPGLHQPTETLIGEKRGIRRRGPSGPVDNLFLGLLGSPSSPPLLHSPEQSFSSSRTSPTVDLSFQDQIALLQGDLAAKTREMEGQAIEIATISKRLQESLGLNQSVCIAKDLMAMELKQLRTDLAATQLLLCQKDEALNQSKSITEDRERCVSPLNNMMLGDSTSTNFFPELQNMRAKLSSVESDFETRSIKMTYKI